MTILILVIGVLCTTLLLFLTYPKQFKRGKLVELYAVDAPRTLDSLDQKSLDYKLLAAGLVIKPITFRLLRLTAAVVGLVITWLVLPGLPAVIVGGVLYYLPIAWVEDHLKSRGRKIDQLLPIAIGRIAAGLLAGGSVPDVLLEVGESLEMEKTNPLSPELAQTAFEMRVKDRTEALRALASRSPSVSLSNLAQLLEGYSDAGGRAYAGVLMDIAGRVQQILIARNRAQAKAGDSLVSARILPAVLLMVLIYLGQDAMVRASLSAFPVQIVIGISMAAMAGGYFILHSMIMEAV